MTTPEQIAANRKNAQKSSGPKSASGKVTSSENARRHGLTGALDAEAVTSWYRVILEDAEAIPDPFEQNAYLRAAANLARAEAHLQRVRAAEEQWLLNPEAPLDTGNKVLEEVRRTLLDMAAPYSGEKEGSRLIERLLKMEAQEGARRRRVSTNIGKTLSRYRAAAEIQRRKALALWTSEVSHKNKARDENIGFL